MSKIDAKALLKRLKSEKSGEKSNYTFRLEKSILRGFKKECEKADLSMSEVIEAFMKDVSSK